MQEITTTSNEQNINVIQINNAIQQYNGITQQNAVTSEEMSVNSKELASQAEQLNEVITVFKLL